MGLPAALGASFRLCRGSDPSVFLLALPSHHRPFLSSQSSRWARSAVDFVAERTSRQPRAGTHALRPPVDILLPHCRTEVLAVAHVVRKVQRETAIVTKLGSGTDGSCWVVARIASVGQVVACDRVGFETDFFHRRFVRRGVVRWIAVGTAMRLLDHEVLVTRAA